MLNYSIYPLEMILKIMMILFQNMKKLISVMD